MKAFFVSVPHSGEKIPVETPWLHHLPESVLMCDIDRYVDQLYRPVVDELQLPYIVAEYHRYVVDLNRRPSDIDQDSVEGSENPPGTFPIGLHWSVTTQGDRLIQKPLSQALHQQLLESYFYNFHNDIKSLYQKFKDSGHAKVYQLDAHSMPSKGTDKHRDPGEDRAEIVISDYSGKSCEESYKDLVMDSFRQAGFQVAYNWPYIGGRVTQTYGHPELGQHALQVELNRRLYMDEITKKLVPDKAKHLQKMITVAVKSIEKNL